MICAVFVRSEFVKGQLALACYGLASLVLTPVLKKISLNLCLHSEFVACWPNDLFKRKNMHIKWRDLVPRLLNERMTGNFELAPP